MTILRSLVLGLAITALWPDLATARSVRVDDTLQEFQFTGGLAPPVNVLSNNGSSGAIAIQSYHQNPDLSPDLTNPLAFSVNLFGTTYNSFYVNENGSISFGGGFGGTPSTAIPDFAGIPVLAPFFADVDSDLAPIGGSISHGFFPSTNGIAITWNSVGYDGQDSATDPRRVSMQVVIIDISDATGVAGDFRLEFNYAGGSEGMEWETGDSDGGVDGLGGMSAIAGFWDGAGLGYALPGSGISGAFLGNDCPSVTALSCNDYFFEFRGGQPFFLDGTSVFAVPEPPFAVLFGLGLGIIGWLRRRGVA